jgi:glycosyltransferase involved in cell wall biosynthesis
MRILIVMASLEADVAEAAETKMTIKALLELGHTVGAVYVQSENRPLEEHPSFVACPVLHQDRKRGPAIAAAIRAFQPDLAHIIACWNPFHVRVSDVLRQLRIPYLMEPGGGMAPVGLDHRFAEKPCPFYLRIARRFYNRFYDLRMLKGAAFIRAVSPFEKNELQRRFRLPSEILPLGYNPEWVTAVRLRRGAGTRPIRFLFLGRVDIFQKGLDLILDAVKLLNAAGLASAFTVTMAGPEVNHSFTRIPKHLQEHGLTNVSLRAGAFGEEKQRLFQEADVFLHPSRFEEIAKMAREASAAGLPVIASEDSNYADWVKDYAMGLPIRLEAADLAAAMRDFIDHPEKAFTMGRAGVEFARTWSWQKVAQGLVGMYQKAVPRA